MDKRKGRPGCSGDIGSEEQALPLPKGTSVPFLKIRIHKGLYGQSERARQRDPCHIPGYLARYVSVTLLAAVNAEKQNTENAGWKMTQTPEMQRRFSTPEIRTPVNCPPEVQPGEPAGRPP